MTDYGRVVQFGVFPEPVAARLDEILALVEIADRDGLDLVGIQDHPTGGDGEGGRQLGRVVQGSV